MATVMITIILTINTTAALIINMMILIRLIMKTHTVIIIRIY